MDSSGNSALRLRANRGKIKESEKVQEELDSKINLNNRRAIKQELDLMNNAVANISSSIIAGITGGALGVAAMAATGGALGISGTGAAIGGAATGLSLWGGGSAAVKTGSDKLGFNEKDRKQLRDLFRKTTKKEDK